MSDELIEKLEVASVVIYSAKDQAALFQALDFGCSALGFDLFLLSCHKARGPEMILEPTLTTLPEKFLSDYSRFGWFADDPLAARILSGDTSFSWNSLTDGHTERRKQSFLDFLAANQLCSGVMLPLGHRPGTVSLMGLFSRASRSFRRNIRQAGTIVANAAMARAEMLGLCPEPPSDAAIATRGLSAPQLEVLKWIAEGKSNLDIATITGLTERAVRYHVAEILRKLGVATRSQAAALFR